MRADRLGLCAALMNPTNAVALTPDPSPAIGRGGGLITKVFARMFALREQSNGARISRVLQNQEGGSELQPRSRPCGRVCYLVFRVETRTAKCRPIITTPTISAIALTHTAASVI